MYNRVRLIMDQSLQFEPEEQGRKFDEQTAERILSLAARLQEREGDKLDEGRLKRIAEEAGVRPEYLELAMRLVDKQAEPVKPPKTSLPSFLTQRGKGFSSFAPLPLCAFALNSLCVSER